MREQLWKVKNELGGKYGKLNMTTTTKQKTKQKIKTKTKTLKQINKSKQQLCGPRDKREKILK